MAARSPDPSSRTPRVWMKSDLPDENLLKVPLGDIFLAVDLGGAPVAYERTSIGGGLPWRRCSVGESKAWVLTYEHQVVDLDYLRESLGLGPEVEL